jgi:hypothetical protein
MKGCFSGEGDPAMSDTGADRNLLFGILALQMDFITRDALIAAMNAWVLDKSKPLGGVLVEQRALSDSRRTLLDALVREHLTQHDGDPARSLAALGPISSTRRAFDQVADPDVHRSLALVAADRTAEEDPFATRLPSAGEATSAGARFRILRPHARGGLGEVFVALDAELNREVALKEIQGRHADHPESRSRFLLEGEVTGGLEIPASCRSTAWASTPTADPSTPCGSSAATTWSTPSPGSTGPRPTRSRRASGRWPCADCWGGSSTCATRSPTRTAAGCSIAT